MLIHTKEIIPALSLNQRRTYEQEEVCELNRIFMNFNRGDYFSRVPIYLEYFKLVKMLVARAELGEFVEYDVDNEDEDWLHEFNEEKELLTPELYVCNVFYDSCSHLSTTFTFKMREDY